MNFDVGVIDRTIASMDKRIGMVIKAKGGRIKYYSGFSAGLRGWTKSPKNHDLFNLEVLYAQEGRSRVCGSQGVQTNVF